jgi:hypothetical protein
MNDEKNNKYDLEERTYQFAKQTCEYVKGIKTNFQYLISNIQSLKIEFCCLEFIWDLFFVNWNFNTDEFSLVNWNFRRVQSL